MIQYLNGNKNPKLTAQSDTTVVITPENVELSILLLSIIIQ